MTAGRGLVRAPAAGPCLIPAPGVAGARVTCPAVAGPAAGWPRCPVTAAITRGRPIARPGRAAIAADRGRARYESPRVPSEPVTGLAEPPAGRGLRLASPVAVRREPVSAGLLAPRKSLPASALRRKPPSAVRPGLSPGEVRSREAPPGALRDAGRNPPSSEVRGRPRYSPVEDRLFRGSLLAGARSLRYSPRAEARLLAVLAARRGPGCGCRYSLLAEARLFRGSVLPGARLVPRGPSPAAGRVVPRVPSPVRADGARRPWSLVATPRAPSAAGVRVLRPAGFLAGVRDPSADALRPVWRVPPPTVPRRRSWLAPAAAGRPRP